MKAVNLLRSRAARVLLFSLICIHVNAGEYDHIVEPLARVTPDAKFELIEPTAVKGIYKVQIERGPTVYMTENGKHFFAGDLFEVTGSQVINIAEQELEAERRELLAKVSEKDMIIFPAKQKKAHLYVFTDIDCYYCQKLHREMDEINALGIEVRYLAFPRSGLGMDSGSYRKIATAWCAKDKNQALTDLKAGKQLTEYVCEDNPVASQYELGRLVGVNGTPALVTAQGQLIPGYKPANDLAKALGVSSD